MLKGIKELLEIVFLWGFLYMGAIFCMKFCACAGALDVSQLLHNIHVKLTIVLTIVLILIVKPIVNGFLNFKNSNVQKHYFSQ